jgi:hypothetical protein
MIFILTSLFSRLPIAPFLFPSAEMGVELPQ